jgi:hypothetical protein
MCLLGSWVRRYCMDKDKIWKSLIDFKYRTCSPNILSCGDAGGFKFLEGGYVGSYNGV